MHIFLKLKKSHLNIEKQIGHKVIDLKCHQVLD